MNKQAYLAQKAIRLAQAPAYKRQNTCYKCFWLTENCRCPLISPFDTDTRFVLLMHIKEAKQEKLGTGRICHATLKNSEIRVGIDFSHDERVNALIADPENYCLVMYPGKKSLNISTDDLNPLQAKKEAGKKLVVFLIDGTWSCAKKMMKLSKNIHTLPRISFSSTHKSIFYIKEQPAEYCLSTLESIQFFLSEADRRGLENLPNRPQDNLLVVFQSMIDFMVACALDPTLPRYRGEGKPRGYSKPENRIRRSKWTSRAIVLPD